MLKPTIYTLIAVACVFTMFGCPPKSSGAPAGIWRVNSNFSCLGSLISVQGFVLRSDGTATHYSLTDYADSPGEGTWTLSGDTLRVYTKGDFANQIQDLVFIGTFQKNKIVNGRATVDGVGKSDCWTAERVEF